MTANPWYVPTRVTAEIAPSRGASAMEALIEALAAGETTALSAVYREHHTAVRAFARRLLGDDAAAEDLVQEAFVSLPAAMGRFEGRSSLRSFVIAVAINHSRHFVRTAARRRRAESRMALEPRTPPGPTPDQSLARQELGNALFRSLDELPLEQRVAFVLSVIEERPSHEVAEIVGAPAPTVRARVQAAKRRLRELLDEGGFR